YLHFFCLRGLWSCIFHSFIHSIATQDPAKREMSNHSSGTWFLLGEFSEVRELQLLQATLFLVAYLAALTGNLLLLAVITLHQGLHTPMYFFLKNLSFLDLGYVSVTVPRAIFGSLTGDASISFWECVFQVFSFAGFGNAEIALLTVMSYDRYVAICQPLRYEVIMKRTACAQMAGASWVSGGLSAILHTAVTFSVPFSGRNVIRQFFCDIPQMIRLSGPRGNPGEVGLIFLMAGLSLACLVSITVSYALIFSTVLKFPSAKGRSKAFSTCLPHLAVVSLFLLTGSSEYLKPTSGDPLLLDQLLSVFYTVIPPALNPIIYSLRNKDIKAALGKGLWGMK
uniref:Olfactory receptor n=2 Tax=Ornithorhynchus anatinus TaxID=9258 RepID=F6UCG1_ORNAN